MWLISALLFLRRYSKEWSALSVLTINNGRAKYLVYDFASQTYLCIDSWSHLVPHSFNFYGNHWSFEVTYDLTYSFAPTIILTVRFITASLVKTIIIWVLHLMGDVKKMVVLGEGGPGPDHNLWYVLLEFFWKNEAYKNTSGYSQKLLVTTELQTASSVM